MTESATCVNCGSTVSAPFCSACGQKNPPKRLNFLQLYGDFQSRVYGFDGMFPRTLRDLTLKPGKVALEFVKGNRVKYVGPVGYFFLTLTVFVLLLQIFEVDFYSFSQENNPLQMEKPRTAAQEKFARDASTMIYQNMRIFTFLQIPITAFFAWLFFRKSNYNYLENAVLVFYISGHTTLISIAFLFIYIGLNVNLSIWAMLIYIPFFAFACTQFYGGRTAKVAFKAVLVNITSLFVFMIVLIAAAVVYLLTHPEIIRSMKSSP